MSFDLDRWKGCLYGQAIGDALGIPLEFKPAIHIAMKFPDGFDMKYRKTVRWGMDPAWRASEFSDDTWQAIKIIEAYLDTLEQQEGTHEFGFDFDLFASNLAQGFIAWVNEDGRGCGTHTGKVFAHPTFWLDPIESSRQVWENSGRRSAANGAAMRSSVCGTSSSPSASPRPLLRSPTTIQGVWLRRCVSRGSWPTPSWGTPTRPPSTVRWSSHRT